MAMVYSEKPCVAAGLFTTNIVKAAPVKWDQEIVYQHPSAQVIICNSGIANACTGEEGFSYCRATAKVAAETLNVDENSVLVASTGVIGMQLPIQKLADGVKAMAPKLQGTLEAGNEAAKAIMTTDTKEKEVAVQIEVGGKTVTIWRHVQRFWNDPSKYVYHAWVCHYRCVHFQTASAGSIKPGC